MSPEALAWGEAFFVSLFASLEIFLEAVFPWRMPFETAFWSFEEIFFRASFASDGFFSSGSASNFFIRVFNSDLILRFLRCFLPDLRRCLYAALFCGIVRSNLS